VNHQDAEFKNEFPGKDQVNELPEVGFFFEFLLFFFGIRCIISRVLLELHKFEVKLL